MDHRRMGMMMATVLSGRAAVNPIIVSDGFAGTNGANVNGRTPDTVSPGNTWTVIAGAFDIQTNKANCATAPAIATIETTKSDFVMSCDITVDGSASSQGLMFRRVDANNWWAVYIKSSNMTFYIFEYTNSSGATRATATVAGLNTGTHTIVLSASDTLISATVDGGNPISYTSASNKTGKIFGIIANAVNQKVDNFLVQTGFSSGVGAYADNAYPTQTVSRSDIGNYILTSPGARLIYTTEADTVIVETYNDIFGTYPGFADIGLRINGADGTAIEPGALGTVTKTVALGAGAKTVEFINGLQSKPGAAPIGSFVCGVSFNKVATKVTPTASPRLLIYGDSITVGANCTNPSLQGWAQLVRDAYSGSMLLEAWGYRTLHDDCATAGARTTFVAHLATTTPAIIWLAIGVNDYALHPWANVAAFGAAYADLLDKLNASMPAAVIYAQTPIVRTVDGANPDGDTLADYRAAIATAQSTRTAFCNLVDGTALIAAGDLDDGVHPTTAGHATYAAAVNTILGIA